MSQTKYDFAVIVALSEEAEYFRRVIACGDPGQIENFTIWPIVDVSWDAFGRGVLVMSGGIGFERARASTAAVIAELKVTLVANLGIAGRVADWLDIGDVVVPREVLDFTSGGKIGGTAKQPAFLHAPVQKDVSSSLVGLAETHIQKDSKILASMNAALKSRFTHPHLWPKNGVKLVFKPIACVPTVGANDQYRKSISDANREIVAMEMESAGVLTAIAGSAVEFVSVRGVSDGADFGKATTELAFGDENRRLALESATGALEAMLTLRVDQREPQTPGAGIEVISSDEILAEDWFERIAKYECVFSWLVHGPDGELVQNPISTISKALRCSDYQEPIVLIGGKGVGKTTLMGVIQAASSQSTQGFEEIRGCLSILVRISALEVWSAGVFDEGRTRNRVTHACQRLGRIIDSSSGPVVLLIDGLNQTGAHRTSLVADLAKEALKHPSVRLLLSAESEVDLHALYSFIKLDVQTDFKIMPVDIDSENARGLLDDFAKTKNVKDTAEIFNDLRKKDVRSIDLFILSLFFGSFRGFAYRNLKSLSQCYGLYCAGVLTESGSGAPIDPVARLSTAAREAFDILISKERCFGDLNEEATARLVSSHSSVTSFLVAQHIINGLRNAKMVGGKSEITTSQLSKRVNYVFPADVNSFTKQIMAADRESERDIIEVIKSRHKKMPTLGKSHFAYLAGRVSRDRSAEMLTILAQIDGVKPQKTISLALEDRMLRRTTMISRSMLGDEQASIDYANIILSDIEESEFNRGFHLEYYGDSPFDSHGRMASRDDGVTPCNRTFARLMDRIRSKPLDLPPLIELLTVLSLVQVRNVHGSLRGRHRREVLELLSGPQLKNRHLLPSNVRGYIERIAEDIQVEGFRLSTVLQEWNGLAQTPRTGWLRRRRDAIGLAAAFWKDVRIESVAEHLVGVLGIAEAFLTEHPSGEETYDKRKIIEMILVHDLAESRLGDLLPKYSDPREEEIVLWQYGAFETYRGLGDLWRVPKLLQEFNRGETVEAKIAKDLDRLQFILQARAYAQGMSEDEILHCENASQTISTNTVRAIEKIVAGAPPKPRFIPTEPLLD